MGRSHCATAPLFPTLYTSTNPPRHDLPSLQVSTPLSLSHSCLETSFRQVPSLMCLREIIASQDLGTAPGRPRILYGVFIYSNSDMRLNERSRVLDVLWRKMGVVLGKAVIGRCCERGAVENTRPYEHLHIPWDYQSQQQQLVGNDDHSYSARDVSRAE
ncbi:hypothetical protein BU23DRAFT_245751 [Bimuria novae-zelandiae CBS 107.79]|uniref:Uncharacterized protein n=1 Tax=Bimuria novae-zelandiae CBS 107.79 TaxID=1447943 RepID=A0A6A5UXE8_9PLEO|nr:hypothetical protein BU23DRAFT_245751 [Bimuria novae-zelandiae CBS 107.79]